MTQDCFVGRVGVEGGGVIESDNNSCIILYFSKDFEEHVTFISY